MAQRLQELCALLVEDTCGYLCSQIFTTLAENGRLSRFQIQQHTRIPARQLRTALAVLAQLHLLHHYTGDEGLTFYSVDWRNSYYLTRSNRIISLAEDRYGQGAGKIMANLLQLGHARVGDLAQAFDFTTTSKPNNEDDPCREHVNAEGGAKTNGAGANHVRKAPDTKINTVGQFHATLRKLLKAGLLTKVNKRIYTPAADLDAEIEEAVISDRFPDGKINGPRKQAEFKTAVNSLKRKWRDNDEFTDRDLESKGTIRRPGEPPGKRARVNGGLTNGAGHDDRIEENVPKLPNEMVLKVNYAQFVLAFRTDRLEQLADSYLGPVTAAVYGALLQALEGKVRARDGDIQADEGSDDEEDDLPVASTIEVADLLDPTIDLTLGIQGMSDTHQLPNGDTKGKKKAKVTENESAGIKREHSDDESEHHPNGYISYESRNKRLNLVEDHLKLLEEHSKGFCKRVGGAGHGEWRVYFSALTDALVQTTVDATILARFGRTHALLVRMLREKGRLAEKEIDALTLMRAKDVRSILTELQYAGIIEAQEVPKDTSRQPTRTLYLYFHDQKRVQSLLLQQSYQGMSRMLQRLKQERENYKNAIEKAEMMDVKQEELNSNERDAVMQWREVEEKLVIQVQRMDEQVALLRDYSGKDSSLVS